MEDVQIAQIAEEMTRDGAVPNVSTVTAKATVARCVASLCVLRHPRSPHTSHSATPQQFLDRFDELNRARYR